MRYMQKAPMQNAVRVLFPGWQWQALRGQEWGVRLPQNVGQGCGGALVREKE